MTRPTLSYISALKSNNQAAFCRAATRFDIDKNGMSAEWGKFIQPFRHFVHPRQSSGTRHSRQTAQTGSSLVTSKKLCLLMK